jgi:hypothetical protein
MNVINSSSEFTTIEPLTQLPPIKPDRRWDAWSDENTTRLRELIYMGYSCARAGLELGYSKNAVSGKINRLGLRGNGSEPPAKRLPSISIIPTTSAGRKRRIHTSAPPKPIAADFIPPNPVTLMELEKHHCRFPSGDSPNVMFCGELPTKGAPYCGVHCRIAYQPSRAPKQWVPGRVQP